MHVRLLYTIIAGLALAFIELQLIFGYCIAAPPHAGPYSIMKVDFDRNEELVADLQHFLDVLRKAAADRDLPAIEKHLAPDFLTIACDTDPTHRCPAANFSGKTTKSSPQAAVQRLHRQLCCLDSSPARLTKQQQETNVLDMIANALQEETIGSNQDLPENICLAAWPIFDRQKAITIAQAAKIDASDLRFATEAFDLRSEPKADAPIEAHIEVNQLVPLINELPQGTPQEWYVVALPQGGYGYTKQLALNELTPSGLCFRKNGVGQWQISASIQRGL